MYDRNDLTWKRCGGGRALYCNGKQAPVLHAVPDENYPHLWRIKRPDGSLTDMVTLARMLDAGMSMAVGILNAGLEAAE